MLFRRAERLYGDMGYQGYRAQVVTYSVARLSNALGRRLPFDVIWKEQAVPEEVVSLLAKIVVGVRGVVTQPPGNRNITEWCKRDECWAAILALPVVADGPSQGGMPAPPDQVERTLDAQATVAAVAAVPAEAWFAASKWAKETATLLPWQRSLAYSLGRLRGDGRLPSPKQAVQGRRLILDAIRLGFGDDKVTKDIIEALAAAEPSAD